MIPYFFSRSYNTQVLAVNVFNQFKMLFSVARLNN